MVREQSDSHTDVFCRSEHARGIFSNIMDRRLGVAVAALADRHDSGRVRSAQLAKYRQAQKDYQFCRSGSQSIGIAYPVMHVGMTGYMRMNYLARWCV